MTLVIVIALVKHKVCYAKKKHSDKRNGSEECLFLVYCILSPESSRINFLHFPGKVDAPLIGLLQQLKEAATFSFLKKLLCLDF